MTNQLQQALAELLKTPFIMGFDGDGGDGGETDDPLDGLSAEDLAVLEELDDAGLTPEQIQALHGLPKPDEKDQAIEGLRSTLRKERQQRRQFEKELKALKNKVEKGVKPPAKAQGNAKDDSNADDDGAAETAAAVQQERQRSERLAASFATNALETTIVRVLGSGAKGVPKFKDPDDVLSLIKRDEIDVDQDEDDPAKVKVDEDDVKSALKDLAKRKPHLLLEEKQEEGAGGSKFGGSRKGGSEKDHKAALKDKYPALNRR